MNKSISKVLGSPRGNGQYAKKSSSVSRPTTASLKNLSPSNIRYGVDGVSVPSNGSGKGTSQIAKSNSEDRRIPNIPNRT